MWIILVCVSHILNVQEVIASHSKAVYHLWYVRLFKMYVAIVRTRRIGFPHCTAVERLLFPWLARDADYVTPSTANSTRRRAVQEREWGEMPLRLYPDGRTRSVFCAFFFFVCDLSTTHDRLKSFLKKSCSWSLKTPCFSEEEEHRWSNHVL